MRRVLSLFLGLVFANCWIAAAGGQVDFSGTWLLDKSRSIGLPPTLVEQTIVVTQKSERIVVAVQQITPQGELKFEEIYPLDGTTVDFVPQGPAGPAGTGKRSAHWLPDGKRLVIEEDSTTDSPRGKVTTHLTRKWSLSADGNTLTVDYYIDRPGVSVEAKRIFVRKQ